MKNKKNINRLLLTHKMPVDVSVNIFCFFFVRGKKAFVFAKQMIHMEYEGLFALQIKKNI